jgi:hypothetical protein
MGHPQKKANWNNKWGIHRRRQIGIINGASTEEGKLE